MVLKNNCAINCYNGKFVITAKSLGTNVAVVTRVDYMLVVYQIDISIYQVLGIIINILYVKRF
jgi:hypothetical protein